MNTTGKILIADDEIYMLRLLEMTFKKGGYAVVSCRDGQEAIAHEKLAGRKVAEDFKAKMHIVFDDLLPQWNYRVIPARTVI